MFNIAYTAHGMNISCPVPSQSYIKDTDKRTASIALTIRKFNLKQQDRLKVSKYSELKPPKTNVYLHFI
jgi:hypothetical protein